MADETIDIAERGRDSMAAANIVCGLLGLAGLGAVLAGGSGFHAVFLAVTGLVIWTGVAGAVVVSQM